MKNLTIFSAFLIFLSGRTSETTEKEEVYDKLILFPSEVFLDDGLTKPVKIYGGNEPYELMWDEAMVVPITGDYYSGEFQAGELIAADTAHLPLIHVVDREIIIENVYGVDAIFLGHCILSDNSGQKCYFTVRHSVFISNSTSQKQ